MTRRTASGSMATTGSIGSSRQVPGRGRSFACRAGKTWSKRGFEDGSPCPINVGGAHEVKNPGPYVRRLPHCGVRCSECEGLPKGRCRRCCRRTRRRAPRVSGRCRGLRYWPSHGEQAGSDASAAKDACLTCTCDDSASAAELKSKPFGSPGPQSAGGKWRIPTRGAAASNRSGSEPGVANFLQVSAVAHRRNAAGTPLSRLTRPDKKIAAQGAAANVTPEVPTWTLTTI